MNYSVVAYRKLAVDGESIGVLITDLRQVDRKSAWAAVLRAEKRAGIVNTYVYKHAYGAKRRVFKSTSANLSIF